mgnify:CR=1 FL=1
MPAKNRKVIVTYGKDKNTLQVLYRLLHVFTKANADKYNDLRGRNVFGKKQG